jgi:broad specificity phosphatase PhoE
VLIMRHCEPHFPKGWCLGQFDAVLSQQGIVHAQAIANSDDVRFSSIRRIVSSDLQRAVKTALPLAMRLGLQLETDARWRELDMGAFTNRSWEMIHAADCDALARWGEHFAMEGPPGGESIEALKVRVRAAFDSIKQPEQCLVVAHEGAIRALMASVYGLNANQAMRQVVAYGEIIEL